MRVDKERTDKTTGKISRGDVISKTDHGSIVVGTQVDAIGQLEGVVIKATQATDKAVTSVMISLTADEWFSIRDRVVKACK